MVNFTLEGRDDGLNVIRLASGEKRKISDESLKALQEGGELPIADDVPVVDAGPGLHPASDAQTGVVETPVTPPESVPVTAAEQPKQDPPAEPLEGAPSPETQMPDTSKATDPPKDTSKGS